MTEYSQKIVDFVQEKPDFLKSYIFHEATDAAIRQKKPRRRYDDYHRNREKPIYGVYKNMCKKYGDGLMDFPEFEFWYWRFYNGNFDMDYDRSSDLPNLSFTDLPVYIFEKISENFNFSDKLIVRRVSKSLQSLIDSWNPKIERIKISKDSKCTLVNYDEYSTSYRNYAPSYYDDFDEDGCLVYMKDTRYFLENEEHWRLGFQDLKAVLENPKLKLNSLEISNFDKEHTEHFQKMLDSLNGAQIHVENFKIPRDGVDFNVLPIIQHLKPEVLKEVHLEFNFNEGEVRDFKEVMRRVGESEQLKKVNMLRCGTHIGMHAQPYDCFLGCSRVTIDVTFSMIAKNAAMAIKTLTNSEVLEVFHLRKDKFNFNVNAIMKLLQWPYFLEVDGRRNVVRCQVPRSNQFYEIEVMPRLIRIERML